MLPRDFMYPSIPAYRASASRFRLSISLEKSFIAGVTHKTDFRQDGRHVGPYENHERSGSDSTVSGRGEEALGAAIEFFLKDVCEFS